jgi:hypothetical protein
MNKRTIISFIICLISFTTYGQEGFETWDQNYPEVDILEIISLEVKYADSIEANTEIPQYFSRIDKYSFNAIYTGEKRSLDESVLASMKRIFKLYIGNSAQVNELVNKEYLFKIGTQEFWMPVQIQLEKPLKKELNKDDEVKLYCLFLNEHDSRKNLYNTLFVSEFQAL